jgi:hypothetical protein
MSKRYWEEEEPVVVKTAKNVIKFFEKAGKLQGFMHDWIDKNGIMHHGKLSSIDVNAVYDDPEAAELFRDIFVR